jgi:hypothetical protein
VRVVVVGSKDLFDEEKIKNEIAKLPVMAVVVHGDEVGTATLAGKIASEMNMETEQFFADSDKHGDRSLLFRNQDMMDTDPDLVLAFPYNKCKDTWDCIRRARAAWIDVVIVE